jgi:S-adenosylhomocysteine hydrolase
MLKSLNSLEQYIRENILLPKQSNGANVYWEVSKNMFSGPDESAYSISVFQENRYDNFNEEFDIALESIHNKIRNIIIDDRAIKSETTESGFVYSWKTSSLDWIRVQITDSCLYLFVFQTGQY